VKINDLVKYKDAVRGMQHYKGIVVGWNGLFPDVLWFNTGIRETEVIEFIEVISESR
jgi:hypothetical protein